MTGVLLTMYDARTTLARRSRMEVREHFGGLVFDTVVPRTCGWPRRPATACRSPDTIRRSAGADAYFRVALEVVERG